MSELYENGELIQRLVADPAQETVVSETSEYTELEQVLVDELLPEEERVPVSRYRIRVAKPGSPESNEVTIRDSLPVAHGELRALIDSDRALQQRAVAARQAIPSQANTTIPNLRDAVMEHLSISRASAQNRIELERVLLNVVRLLSNDFTTPAEPEPTEG